ncbi:hypothetical protein HDU96_004156, partial [Phlyctochytrium bullatum]
MCIDLLRLSKGRSRGESWQPFLSKFNRKRHESVTSSLAGAKVVELRHHYQTWRETGLVPRVSPAVFEAMMEAFSEGGDNTAASGSALASGSSLTIANSDPPRPLEIPSSAPLAATATDPVNARAQNHPQPPHQPLLRTDLLEPSREGLGRHDDTPRDRNENLQNASAKRKGAAAAEGTRTSLGSIPPSSNSRPQTQLFPINPPAAAQPFPRFIPNQQQHQVRNPTQNNPNPIAGQNRAQPPSIPNNPPVASRPPFVFSPDQQQHKVRIPTQNTRNPPSGQNQAQTRLIPIKPLAATQRTSEFSIDQQQHG